MSVIVTNARNRIAYNVVRSLGQRGIDLYTADFVPRSMSFSSRYSKGHFVYPSPFTDQEGFVQRLIDEIQRLRVDVLIPVFEETFLVAKHADRFSKCVSMVVPTYEHILLAHNKDKWTPMARKLGIPVPGSYAIEEIQSGAVKASDLRYPVLVKPKLKTDWDSSAVFSKLLGGAGKARIFADGRAVLRDPLAQSLAGELAVQEYIPGDDRTLWSFHGFADERGKLLAWFIGRKIRTYPALTGDSSYLELAHDAGLAALGHGLVQRIGLKGVFKMDFKRHATTGQFYLLEVNARFNLWHYLGAKGGVNLAQVAYDYMMRGVRSAPIQSRTRHRWLSPRLDYLAYRSLAARGELDATGWLASLIGGPKVYDLFAWTDPMPFVAVVWDELKHLSRLRRRLMRWLCTAS